MSQRALGVPCVVTVLCLGSLRSHKAEFKLSLRLPEGLTRSDLQHKTTNLASSFHLTLLDELGRYRTHLKGCFTPLTPLSGTTSSCQRSLDQERNRSRLLGGTIATKLCRFKVPRLFHTFTRTHHRRERQPEQISCSYQLRARGLSEEWQAGSKTMVRIERAFQFSAVILRITLDSKLSSQLARRPHTNLVQPLCEEPEEVLMSMREETRNAAGPASDEVGKGEGAILLCTEPEGECNATLRGRHGLSSPHTPRKPTS